MLVVLFDLAADVQQERAIGGVDHLDALHRFDRRDDPLPVLLARCVDDDVAQAVVAVHLDQVDRADHPAGLRDRARQLPERPERVVDPNADGELNCALGVALTELVSSEVGGTDVRPQTSLPRERGGLRARPLRGAARGLVE